MNGGSRAAAVAIKTKDNNITDMLEWVHNFAKHKKRLDLMQIELKSKMQ